MLCQADFVHYGFLLIIERIFMAGGCIRQSLVTLDFFEVMDFSFSTEAFQQMDPISKLNNTYCFDITTVKRGLKSNFLYHLEHLFDEDGETGHPCYGATMSRNRYRFLY